MSVVEMLWAGGVLLVPLTLLVAAACRLLPMRPASRHLLWASLLVLPFVLAAGLPVAARVLVPARTPTPDTMRVATQGTPAKDVRPVVASRVRSATPPRRMEETVATARPAAVMRPAIAGPPAPPKAEQEQTVVAASAASIPGDAPASTAASPPAPSLVPAAPTPERVSAGEAASLSSPSLPSSSLPSSWQRWLTALDDVRLAITAVPPLPGGVWLFGFAIVFAVTLGCGLRTHRIIAAARPAPFGVAAIVLEEASRLGMRRAPETLMVDRRLSPMIWCGRRARLVLPAALWSQLDDAGRRAVVLHELAHLKRADHWLCRAQIIVGMLYWWHPLVWWVRHRLADEADNCCDAWVTALRPRERRAYAQALLDTRKYVDRPVGTWGMEPAVGLGVNAKRKRHFARRLTMVMTEQKTPRLSIRGVALAGLLVAAGCLAAPVFACPPSKDTCVKAPKAPKASKAPMRLRIEMPTPPAAAPMPDPETSYERYLRDRAQPARGGGDDLEDRLREMEKRIQQLYERLGRTIGEHGQNLQQMDWPEELNVALEALQSHEAFGQAQQMYQQAMQAMHGDDDQGERIVRKYDLPEGKLGALTEIMVREDVPVLVRPLDDGIEVHGTAAEHHVFAAFCKLINGEESVQMYSLPADKAEAINALMVRGDVPILVEPRDDGVKVHGTDLEQAVFAAFMNMIHPDGAHGDMARELDQLAERYEGRAREGERLGRPGRRADRDRLRAEQQRMRRQSENLRHRAEQMEERADALEEDAEALQEAAERLKGDIRERLLRESRALAQQAEELTRQAAQTEAEAEAIEERADAVEAEADKLDEKSGER